MRFDDSLATVLAADTETAHGAAAAWRQLVDLAARRRIDDAIAVERLRDLRRRVPAATREASGRALAMAEPPATLVALFAEDDLAIAAPVLRAAQLDSADWLTLLPSLSPSARAVLRHRRDLPVEVVRGLASFGATDFVLEHDAPADDLPFSEPDTVLPAPTAAPEEPRFEIADLVARIDAFRRERPAPVVSAPAPPSDSFQFHTDADGVIRWVEGVARTPLIGVTLASPRVQGVVSVPPEAGTALRERRPFRDATLTVEGASSATGLWRIAGEPRFDPVVGGFTGMAGVARRIASPPPVGSASDALRELVHELRTPANAITGFSEMIATELLGPAPAVYRDRAALIRRQGGALAEAIADLDMAARIEGDALESRSAALDLSAIIADAVTRLRPHAKARHVRLLMAHAPAAFALVDDRAARRLIDRLLTVLVAAALPGEQLAVHVVVKTRSIRMHVTRPRALPAGDDRLLAIDEAEGDEMLLLGVGFTLRLVRSLAVALGGSLAISEERLTLRLPTAVTAEVEQAAAQ